MRHGWLALPIFAFVGGAVAWGVPASADAPSGRYTIRTDTVIDNRTSLEWQRVEAPTTMMQFAARSYCAELDLGGHSDWVLPTIKELLSLVDPTRGNNDPLMNPTPSIDPIAFPDNPLMEEFWSDTPVMNVPNMNTHAWAVDFKQGNSFRPQVDFLLEVRCVRYP